MSRSNKSKPKSESERSADPASTDAAAPVGDPVIIGAEPEPAPRVSRHIQPLGPRVLVRIVKNPDRSEAGLFLPQGVKDSHAASLLGEVIEVARSKPREDVALDDDDDDDDDDAPGLGENVSGIPLGANVLFEKERGIAVPWDDSLRILEVRYVLAIVDIIGQDEIQ